MRHIRMHTPLTSPITGHQRAETQSHQCFSFSPNWTASHPNTYAVIADCWRGTNTNKNEFTCKIEWRGSVRPFGVRVRLSYTQYTHSYHHTNLMWSNKSDMALYIYLVYPGFTTQISLRNFVSCATITRQSQLPAARPVGYRNTYISTTKNQHKQWRNIEKCNTSFQWYCPVSTSSWLSFVSIYDIRHDGVMYGPGLGETSIRFHFIFYHLMYSKSKSSKVNILLCLHLTPVCMPLDISRKVYSWNFSWHDQINRAKRNLLYCKWSFDGNGRIENVKNCGWKIARAINHIQLAHKPNGNTQTL